MAEPLKNFFSRTLVSNIGASIEKVHASFPTKAFVRDACAGLDSLELIARGQHIAAALHEHLPAEYPAAIDVIVRSLGPLHPSDELEGVGMAPFFYLPHVIYVAAYGLNDFDVSMKAQHALTQRFTCEWSIRPFLEQHADATLKVLQRWVKDPSAHVRRLVSEGTRPRLPWAPRVRWIEKEPKRVLPLLESLKDDRSSVVRRSVANHLNDLAKSNPDLVCEIAGRWLEGASEDRQALVKHALRSLIKKANPKALTLLGFGKKPRIELVSTTFTPKKVKIGERTRIEFTIQSTAAQPQTLGVDLVVHFIKAKGQSNEKVFKISSTTLAAKQSESFGKTISLAVHTTRKPYPGPHRVDALINGQTYELGTFTVVG